MRRTAVPPRLLASSVLVVTTATLPLFLTASTQLQLGAELGFGTTGLGVLASLFFMTSALSSIPLGRMVERIGWRTAMRINVTFAAAILLAIALLARSATSLGGLLVMAAAAYGMANPAANLALARQAGPSRRALVFGIKHAGIPTSSLLAGVAVPVVALTLGWRWTFALGAAASLAVLALIPPGAGVPAPVATGRGTRPAPMANRRLTSLALGSAFATTAAVALGTFTVGAAVESGFSESVAGTLLAAGSLASIIARVGYGMVADRRRSDGLTGLALLMGSGALVFLALTQTAGTAFALLTVIAFATGWGWPGLLTYAVVHANEGTPAASTAITQAGVFLGAGTGPVVLGWLIDTFSYEAAWLTVAVALAVAMSMVGIVRRAVHRDAALRVGDQPAPG